MTALLVLAFAIADPEELRALSDAVCNGDAVSACATSSAVDSDAPFAGLIEATVNRSVVDGVVQRVEPLLDPQRHLVLEADERQVVPFERDWQLGEPSPGDRVVTVVVRKPSMTRRQFDTYWKDVHTDVALSY